MDKKRERETLIYIALVGCIFLCEWFLKNIVETWCREGEKKDILGGRLFLTKYHNEGALLNLGEKRKGLVASVSFVLSMGCMILLIVSLLKRDNAWLKAGLSLLLGGAFSNTYDRLRRKYVVDYFGFHCKHFKKLSKVVFNLSDFFIIVGAAIIAASSVR